jgi:hypothetical protein
MAIPFRQASRQQSRQMSTDPRNELHPHVEHYIGIDVGTGSARACIMNDQGDIVGLASENIGLWQPQTGYYVLNRSNEGDIEAVLIKSGTIYFGYLALYLFICASSHGPTQHRARLDSWHRL